MQPLKVFIPPFIFGFFVCLGVFALLKYALPIEYHSYIPSNMRTWLALDAKMEWFFWCRPLMTGLTCGFLYGIYEYIRQRSREQKNNDSAESA